MEQTIQIYEFNGTFYEIEGAEDLHQKLANGNFNILFFHIV